VFTLDFARFYVSFLQWDAVEKISRLTSLKDSCSWSSYLPIQIGHYIAIFISSIQMHCTSFCFGWRKHYVLAGLQISEYHNSKTVSWLKSDDIGSDRNSVWKRNLDFIGVKFGKSTEFYGLDFDQRKTEEQDCFPSSDRQLWAPSKQPVMGCNYRKITKSLTLSQ